jgi:hypothetical protein
MAPAIGMSEASAQVAHHLRRPTREQVDAMRLAQLLRLDMVPRAHAASYESRNAKEIVRQRSCWVGIRNRIHRLLGGVPFYCHYHLQ